MTNILKKMTREDVTNSKEYQLAKLAMEWFATHDDEVDALDGYEAGYQQAIEHPTGGELLHVLNKGHKQGYKDAVEKACKWIEENFQFDEAGYCTTNFYSKDSMLHSFRIDTKED